MNDVRCKPRLGVNWSKAPMLHDIFFPHWAHASMIHATSHVDHERKSCMVFYLYACMWLCSCSPGAPLGCPLGRQSLAMSKEQVPVTKIFLQHID